MSIRLLQQLLYRSPKVRDGEFRILAYLADLANDQGWCFPSVAKLADYTALSPGYVERALQLLARFGWLQRVKRDGRRGFQLTLDDALADPSVGQQRLAESDPRIGKTRSQDRACGDPGIATRAAKRMAKADLSTVAGSRAIDDPYVRTPPGSQGPDAGEIPLLRSKRAFSVVRGTSGQEQRGRPRDARTPGFLTADERRQLSKQPADDGNYAVLMKLAHSLLDNLPDDVDPDTADFRELLKRTAAAERIVYDKVPEVCRAIAFVRKEARASLDAAWVR